MVKQKIITGLPKNFPFKNIFEKFIKEYSSCSTYWYVPKTRALNDKNVKTIKAILEIISDDFSGQIWNNNSQDKLLNVLKRKKILAPYIKEANLSNRTALSRIWKKWLETFGFLWVQNNKEMIATDAGLELISVKNPRSIVESQIAKLQYPSPTLTGKYSKDFKGLLPHLFLLQILKKCGYKLSFMEFEIFVNLARAQNDTNRISNYIKYWRDLSHKEQIKVLNIIKKIRMFKDPGFTRYRRIQLSHSYQISIFTFPKYLKIQKENNEDFIVSGTPKLISGIIESKLENLKITDFSSKEDWFSYFGDPKQQPSWYTHLSHEVERAKTFKEAKIIVKKYKAKLNPTEIKEIEKKQREKGIEEYYAKNLSLLESGLLLFKDGRQYPTPIGKIDLLCKAKKGEFVVIEIKFGDAEDAVFGQILRYIGWIHRNIEDGENNVRGIILAGRFPDAARYSRIGLLKENYKEFLRFKTHGFTTTDI